MEIIQSLTGQVSWSTIIITALGLALTTIYVNKTSKAKAEEISRDASKRAIEELQILVSAQDKRIGYQDGRIEDLEKALKDCIKAHKHENI